MKEEEVLGWLILLGVWIVTTIIFLIIRAKGKTDLQTFYLVFPGVNTVCLFLWTLFVLFDNN